jgi:hypothetical protein
MKSALSAASDKLNEDAQSGRIDAGRYSQEISNLLAWKHFIERQASINEESQTK